VRVVPRVKLTERAHQAQRLLIAMMWVSCHRPAPAVTTNI
jgi:hypothetical protein